MKLKIFLLFFITFNFTEIFAGKDSSESKKISLNGYMEPYFSWQPHAPETEKNIFYNYTRSNALSLNLALLTLKYTGNKWRGTLSVQTGDFPVYNYASEPYRLRHIYEAYAGYRISERVSIDGGIFSSHIGHESAVGKDNWNLTRSFSAENTPYYETGIRMNYSVNDKLTFMIAVLNGWQRIKDNNKWPALGTQLQFKPSDNITVNSSTFIGNEQPEGYRGKVRYFHDFYIEIQGSGNFDALFSFDSGIQHNIEKSMYGWFNPTLKLRYRCRRWLSFATRAEYFGDKHQVIIATGTEHGIQAWGVSANADIALNRFILLRTEARFLNAQNGVVYYGRKVSNNLSFYTFSLCLNF